MSLQDATAKGEDGNHEPARHVLYVTSSPDKALVRELASAGWTVEIVGGGKRSPDNGMRAPAPVALMELRSDFPSETEVRDLFAAAGSGTRWIALTTKSVLADPAVRSLIRRGFYDFHTVPANIDRLLVTLGRGYGMAGFDEDGATHPGDETPDFGIIGDSPAIQALRRAIVKVGVTDAPVLIGGESGTGKELTARAIHAASSRRDGPFVPVNCGSIPPSLIQSELFGYEKGAFTGALKRQLGKIEAASGGSILLDEIGDLSLDLQVNLLRFLEERRIQRVGSVQETKVDVRVIAATHVDLLRAVQQGHFREDLYYRLNVLRVHVPPLRTRLDDIDRLAEHFFERFAAERQPCVKGFSCKALAAMRCYHWPGNVREMINRVRHAAIMSDGPLINPKDLGLDETLDDAGQFTLDAARIAAEKGAIALALSRSGDNLSQAARTLDVTRSTLYRLMEKHRIRVDEGPDDVASKVVPLRHG